MAAAPHSPTPTRPSAPPSPSPSLARKLVYTVIASVLGSVLFFSALEGALRLGGYGYSPHFVRKETLADGTQVWRENGWCTAPYFSRALVRRPQPFRLPVSKPARTYRVFILGSSAAMGDPEPSFSIARMLQVLLRNAYPDVHFEVVNAAITAINSHVVRGIAADCAALQPDLYVVYEGNNEVIGPFGPSGVFAPFLRSEKAVRLAGWVKGTRTGQLFNAFGQILRGHGGRPKEWGGMQMFLAQQIGEDDLRLRDVQAHFRANLLTIADSARRAGATTLLCTVLTNQRDFAPFMSRHRADLSALDLQRWQAAFDAALAAERTGDFSGAERQFQAALAIDDRYAELDFRLGRLELQLGHDAAGQRLLQQALDCDTLRFRTDSKLNDVIRAVAATAPGAHLVDVAANLAPHSAHGCIGDDLLYEHVHLNFRGTYEVASALVPQIAADLQRRGLASGPPARLASLNEMHTALAFTAYEQGMIAVELLRRFRAAPFTGQIDDGLRVATWERRVEAASALLRRPEATPALAALYRTALNESPNDWVLARNAGAMLVARGQPAEAIPLLQHAAAIIPDDADTLVALGLAERDAGHPELAEPLFAKVRLIEPHHPLLPKP